MNKLEGKLAVVSGATSGIGKAIAQRLTQKGVKVINVSKDSCETGFFKDIQCDISDDGQLLNAVREIESFGKLDLLFCNAGFGIGGSVENASIDAIDKLFNVNLIAHVKAASLLSQNVVDGGKIFFTGSLASIIPLPFQACYSASKAGVENFSRALNTELKPRKIQVCTIMPGDIATGFTDARIKPTIVSPREERGIRKMERSERQGAGPDTVAKVALNLAKKRRLPLRVTVGFGNKVLALLVKLLPIRLTDWFVSKIYI